MVDFTVAIRTYNGAQRLPKILDALAAQVTGNSPRWEIVIVDNNSTDKTYACVERYQANWTACPLRYVSEPRQGASYARRRAIAEAKGTWVGFLDDDNIPDANWVRAAYYFGLTHPRAAAFGSQIHAIYEVAPPAHFERIAPFIPIVERDEAICFTEGRRALSNLVPPGAGLVIQRQAWQTHVPLELTLKGPVGTNLAQKGEDVEALLYLKKAGWEIWFNPDMHIYHQISSKRFERDYLIRFFRGIGLSKHTTRMVACQPWQRPAMTLLYLLSDLRKVLHHWLKYRRQLGQDVIVACEFQLFLSSLWSPFHTWQQQLTQGPEWLVCLLTPQPGYRQ